MNTEPGKTMASPALVIMDCLWPHVVAHDCVIGNNVIMANNATLGGHVHIGDFAVGRLVRGSSIYSYWRARRDWRHVRR